MKTIVIDGIFFQLNEWSGIAKYWRTMLNEMDIAASAHKNLRIYLLARGESTSLRKQQYSNIHILPFSYFDPVCAISDFENLSNICKSLNADAFISSYYTLAYGTPNIGMAYDFIPEAMGWMSSHTWKIKEIYMRSLEYCFSISKATAESASIYYPNITSEQQDIFYPPMEQEELTVYSREAIRGMRIKHALHYPYAAIVGHRSGYKNVDLLSRALRERPPDCKPIPLGIVATAGEELKASERQLYQQHFQFGLRRLELSKGEMPMFLNAADALFYPSLLEGFGYPVAEALAQGCPVITTGATSISEILDHAEPTDYQLISGHDADEGLATLIRMMHSRKRASSATAKRIQKAFCKKEADRFLQRLIALASISAPPRTPYLEACLSLDGILT